MMEWLAANAGTIVITLMLIGIVTLIIVNLRKRKMKGGSCCGNCAACSHCSKGGSCH